MNLPTAVATCFRKYATFSGRAPRSEYWYFQLFNWLIFLALAIVLSRLGPAIPGGTDARGESPIIGSVIGIYFLAIMLPNLAVAVRRLHDVGRSGWWYLIAFAPFGGLVLFAWCCMRGTSNDAGYGPSTSPEVVADVF